MPTTSSTTPKKVLNIVRILIMSVGRRRRFLQEAPHFWFKSCVKHQRPQSVNQLRNDSSCFLLVCIKNISCKGWMRISNSNSASKNALDLFGLLLWYAKGKWKSTQAQRNHEYALYTVYLEKLCKDLDCFSYTF